MQFGLIEALGDIQLSKAGVATYIGLKRPATLATSINFTFPNALPGSTQALTVDSSGNMGYVALGGGGTVTSVALSVPSFLSIAGSPVTSAGTLAVSLATQTANTFFAGASSGGATTPTFRALVYGDLSALVGTALSTIAAGNDSRFHTQNTDTATTSAVFQLDSGNSGVKLKNVSGALALRNAADSAPADLVIGNLTVSGTTTSVNSETVTIDDNIIVLNNNVSTGTPTENGGIQIRRGASSSSSLIWDETNGRWSSGLAGSEVPLSRYYSLAFVNADLVSGVLTVTHSLSRQFLPVVISNGSNKIVIPDQVTFTSASALTIDLTNFGTLSGTWNVSAG